MSETEAPIRLSYAWEEKDFSAYLAALRLYWAQDGLQTPPTAQPSTGWAYARYYLVPAIITVAAISLWSWLFHRQWWPATTLHSFDTMSDFILTGLFPQPAAVFLMVLAGMAAMSQLDQRRTDASPDPAREAFDTVVGFTHEVAIGPDGFDVSGPNMRGTYFWSVEKTGALPVALIEGYVLVAHPNMLLAIPEAAIPISSSEFTGRIIAWRDAAIRNDSGKARV
ncbi:hypothetical protein [Paracoccus tegillarcae]|uniref:Uncharacterized protein n=1 Tax=Paracoccus tegillarcae TaxID=1529068 RepID=A0A2K9EHV9_9RHOB|nr:hypothetical protein [Paracoccus tegillarcae]AUH33929.1 hypothetical protein CUV01_11495 [Paracoccus tegillarcae]